MKIRDEFPGIATVDVLWGLMLLFAVLLRLSILAINIDAGSAKEERVKNSNLALIRLQWPGDSTDDLDLYVEDPLNHIVFFRRMEDGLMILDHDDTGSQSNILKLPDGREVHGLFNEENVTIRGIVPGEYTVNVHSYGKKNKEVTPAVVTLYKIQVGGDIQLYQTALKVDHQGQEQTAFRFSMDAKGELGGINQLKKFFVKAAQEQVPSKKAAPTTTPEAADTPTPTPSPSPTVIEAPTKVWQ